MCEKNRPVADSSKNETPEERRTRQATELGIDLSWTPPDGETFGPAPLENDERERLEATEWVQEAHRAQRERLAAKAAESESAGPSERAEGATMP
jgi:hypothetical protein